VFARRQSTLAGRTASTDEAMPRLLHRHRKCLSSTVLGMWVFALFVGIANACSWDGVTAMPHQPTAAVHADGETIEHEMAPGCEDFCSNDLPLFSVLKLVQDQPAGQPLVLATRHDLGLRPIFAPNLRLARNAHPPPGVPFSLRFVRLTL
jgi:hypothetical protein